MNSLLLLFGFFNLNASPVKTDTSFLRSNFDISIGSNKNFGLSIEKNENLDVSINAPFTPCLITGMSFQYEVNYIFSINLGVGYNAFSISFNYEDRFNEFGANISDSYILRNLISYADISASKLIYLRQKRLLTIGIALCLTFQKFSRSSSSVSAIDLNNNNIWLMNLNYQNNELLPGISPKLVIEYELIHLKNSSNSLFIFSQYNYSPDKISEGEFRFYDGNSAYSIGKLALNNHYLTMGFRFRFGDL